MLAKTHVKPEATGRGLGPLVGFIARRLVWVIPLALAAATLVFVVMESAPGDPADYLLGDRPIPPEVRQRIERAYGLDRPPVERYVSWLGALAFDFELGWSHSRSQPVSDVLRETLPNTLLLASGAFAIHLLSGVLLGALCAARQGGGFDRAVSSGSLLLYAMPTFWLGLMAVLALSYYLPLFPASSMHSVGAEEWSFTRRAIDTLWHLCLPAGVLGLASTAVTIRLVREGILRALGEVFVRAARARGVAGSRLLLVHALRNAALPVVNLTGLSLPALLSGSLVIEVVFAWPGMGRLTYEAIQAQDFPVVLASTLLATLLVVLGSLVADLAMGLLDPRIRLAGGGGA